MALVTPGNVNQVAGQDKPAEKGKSITVKTEVEYPGQKKIADTQ